MPLLPICLYETHRREVDLRGIYVEDSSIIELDDDGIRHPRKHSIKALGGTTSTVKSFLELHMTYDIANGRLEMRHTYCRNKIYDDHYLSTDIYGRSEFSDARCRGRAGGVFSCLR